MLQGDGERSTSMGFALDGRIEDDMRVEGGSVAFKSRPSGAVGQCALVGYRVQFWPARIEHVVWPRLTNSFVGYLNELYKRSTVSYHIEKEFL